MEGPFIPTFHAKAHRSTIREKKERKQEERNRNVIFTVKVFWDWDKKLRDK